MNAKEQQEAFAAWWDEFGSAMRPKPGEDAEEHVHRITRLAWFRATGFTTCNECGNEHDDDGSVCNDCFFRVICEGCEKSIAYEEASIECGACGETVCGECAHGELCRDCYKVGREAEPEFDPLDDIGFSHLKVL